MRWLSGYTQSPVEEDDGSLVLLLATTGRVVFTAAERVRVSNLFLRLANRHY